MGPKTVGTFHFTPTNIPLCLSVHIPPLLLNPMTNEPFSPPLIKLGRPAECYAALFVRSYGRKKTGNTVKQHLVGF